MKFDKTDQQKSPTPKRRKSLRSHPSSAKPIATMDQADEVQMVRRVVSPSHYQNTTSYTCLTMGYTFPCESEMEHHGLYWLDTNPDIVAIYPQPEWLLLFPVEDNQPKKTCPDFLVVYRDGSEEYVEIKSDEEASRPEVEARTIAAKRHAAAKGRSYVVLKSSQIRDRTGLSNRQLIKSAGTHHVPDDLQSAIFSALKDVPRSMVELATALNVRVDEAYWACLNLTFRGLLKIDLEVLITTDTTVRRAT